MVKGRTPLSARLGPAASDDIGEAGEHPADRRRTVARATPRHMAGRR